MQPSACRRLAATILFLVADTSTLLIGATGANAACGATERTKFVYLAQHDTTYGAQEAILPESTYTADCGRPLARTIHMHIGPATWDDFVEIGIRTTGNALNESYFMEAQIYPSYTNPNIFFLTTNDGTVCECGKTYFALTGNSAVGDYAFKGQYHYVNGYWTNIGVTPSSALFYYNYGMNLSEVSLRGAPTMTNAMDVQEAKYLMPGAPWADWDHLWCATLNTGSWDYSNRINDWDAHAASTTAWYTTHNAPPAGDC